MDFKLNLKKKLEDPSLVEDAQIDPLMDDVNSILAQLAEVNPELAKNIKEIELNTLQVMLKRNKEQSYGESYAIMGVQGAAFQVIHKAARLLNTIYDTEEQGFKLTGKQMVKESIDNDGSWKDNSSFGHLLDLLNYSRLTLNLFIRARNQGMLTDGKEETK